MLNIIEKTTNRANKNILLRIMFCILYPLYNINFDIKYAFVNGTVIIRNRVVEFKATPFKKKEYIKEKNIAAIKGTIIFFIVDIL